MSGVKRTKTGNTGMPASDPKPAPEAHRLDNSILSDAGRKLTEHPYCGSSEINVCTASGSFEFGEMGSAIARKMGSQRCDCNVLCFRSASSTCSLLSARRCSIEDNDYGMECRFRGNDGVSCGFGFLGYRSRCACRAEMERSYLGQESRLDRPVVDHWRGLPFRCRAAWPSQHFPFGARPQRREPVVAWQLAVAGSCGKCGRRGTSWLGHRPCFSQRATTGLSKRWELTNQSTRLMRRVRAQYSSTFQPTKKPVIVIGSKRVGNIA